MVRLLVWTPLTGHLPAMTRTLWWTQLSDQADGTAQARTAVMTTSATSLGWEIMATCEAPSISVTVAPMRS